VAEDAFCFNEDYWATIGEVPWVNENQSKACLPRSHEEETKGKARTLGSMGFNQKRRLDFIRDPSCFRGEKRLESMFTTKTRREAEG
jgi:hypothetical protein